MNKQLTAKIQKINPKLPDEAKNIARAIVIEPDDEIMLEKKGTLYTVFDVSSKKSVDNLLVSKIVNDVLHDSYFQAESTSPIQSIEKSILKLRDNMVELTKTGDALDSDMSFNIATAVLWGNTLYLVQYGSTAVYLMRDGTTKPIDSATEGSFAVASGVIKDNDVVILATENFSEKYPPEKLVGISGIGIDELDELESSMILKFNIKKEFSEDEVLDFGHKVQNTMSIAEDEPVPSRRPHRLKSSKPNINLKEKPKWIIAVFALFILLVLFVIGSRLLDNNGENTEAAQESNALSITETQPQPAATETTPVIDIEQDRANKITRITPEVFYDLKLADTSVNVDDIEVTDLVIVASDNATGNLYVSDIKTPKFAVIPDQTYSQIHDLIKYEEAIGFFDSEGFKVYDPINQEVTNSYSAAGIGPSTTYLDFVYAIADGAITKYTKGEGALSGEVWAKNTTTPKIKDMGIDQRIYAITDDNQLVRFTTGELDNFEVSGLDKPLNNPKKIVVDIDLENIYIVDAGNNRILILDKQGVLLRQLKLENETDWGDLKSIAINYNETMAYVVNGTKVYEVDLTVQNPEDAEETDTLTE